jgi:acyl-CoA reductase-like NAD-dependent aldehyde dehydrogenase
VDRAVRSAAAAFESREWASMSNRTRAKLINKLADVFEANLEEMYHLETLNNGRPVNETRAQVSRLPDFLRYNAGLAIARRDSVIPVDGNYLNYTIRTPIGVVGNSTPFNHPLMIMIKSLAPTLASGCTTVVKPSEYTPLTTLRLAALFVEAGLPPGVFNVVTGLGPTTGKALAEHPGLAKWVLTGGTEAGRITGASAGRNFAHQTLELGGKTPVLVFDDYDVDQAVNLAAFGAFVGAGQTCICGSRQIVQDSIYDAFVEKLAAKAKSIRIGNPVDASVQLGPVVSARQQQRVLGYINIGLNEDKARLVAGGKVPSDPALANGFFVEPTVFADVTPEMRIFQEEVFGPFVSVSKFSTEEEALALANNSPFGLAGAVRTKDVTRAHRVAAKIKCGIVWINDHHRLDPASPWGGVKDSGIGRECGTESFDQHFETKSVMVRMDDSPFDWYRDTASQPRLN